jgi:uridine phosphorylase
MSDTPTMTEAFALSGTGNLFKQEDFDFCAQMEAKLAAMTAAKELAERQVAVLLPSVSDGCPTGRHVGREAVCMASISCEQCWLGWSREAAKGVAKPTA